MSTLRGNPGLRCRESTNMTPDSLTRVAKGSVLLDFFASAQALQDRLEEEWVGVALDNAAKIVSSPDIRKFEKEKDGEKGPMSIGLFDQT